MVAMATYISHMTYIGGKMKIGIYCYLTADVLQKCSYSSLYQMYHFCPNF